MSNSDTQARFTRGRWQACRVAFEGTRDGDDWVIDLVMGDDELDEDLRGMAISRPALGVAPDLGRLMEEAIREPLTGTPHLPAVVRVASEELAGEIRARRPDVRLEIGPTTALDEIGAEFAEEALPDSYDEDWSWLARGVTPAQVSRLFEAAERLAGVEIDEGYVDEMVLRVEIDGFGDGPMWVNLGLEPMDDDVRLHAAAIAPHRDAREAWRDDDSHADEVVVFMCEFVTVSVRAWKEAQEHGWPLRSKGFYPRVLAGGEDEAIPEPKDVDLAIAVLEALAAGLAEPVELFMVPAEPFEVKLPRGGRARLALHPEDNEGFDESLYDFDLDDLDDDFDPDDDDDDDDFLGLDLTRPWADAPPPAPATVRKQDKPGRNDPCWCGSGKKYKKCHLDEDQS